jgi:hypothetical protein
VLYLAATCPCRLARSLRTTSGRLASSHSAFFVQNGIRLCNEDRQYLPYEAASKRRTVSATSRVGYSLTEVRKFEGEVQTDSLVFTSNRLYSLGHLPRCPHQLKCSPNKYRAHSGLGISTIDIAKFKRSNLEDELNTRHCWMSATTNAHGFCREQYVSCEAVRGSNS